jgi:hypothetical protein
MMQCFDFGGKSTEEKEDIQGRGCFFCRGGVSELNSNDLLRCTDAMNIENADWQSAEKEEERVR